MWGGCKISKTFEISKLNLPHAWSFVLPFPSSPAPKTRDEIYAKAILQITEWKTRRQAHTFENRRRGCLKAGWLWNMAKSVSDMKAGTQSAHKTFNNITLFVFKCTPLPRPPTLWAAPTSRKYKGLATFTLKFVLSCWNKNNKRVRPGQGLFQIFFFCTCI